MKTHRPGRARLVPALAAAHLRHDWILTLCLVIALTAVIAPLLVLLGLKHGTIETLRERLVEDPVYRELRPTQTQPYSEDWFAQVAAWPGVAFLTPTILPLSSVVQVVRADETTSLFDLIPTAAGDPFLLENGVPVPGEDEVVLTAEAARLSGVAVGDRLSVRVSRTRGGRSENVQAELKVVGILPIGAGTLTRLYAPLAFVLDVESYKEGYAAARRGWPGDTPDPYPSFDGVVLLLDEPLSPIVRTGAIIQTGFARIGEITRDQAETLLGLPIPQRLHAYDLSTPNTPITQSNIRAIQTKLRGREPLLLPYVRDLELIGADGRPWRPAGLSVDAAQAARLDLPPVPWGGFQARRERAEELTSVLWPVDAESNPDADTRQVRMTASRSRVRDVRSCPSSCAPWVRVPCPSRWCRSNCSASCARLGIGPWPMSRRADASRCSAPAIGDSGSMPPVSTTCRDSIGVCANRVWRSMPRSRPSNASRCSTAERRACSG
jgi:putative ABC transport system permease protein